MKKNILREILPLFVILAFAVIFRFYKLRIAPDWYQDEGEFIRLASYLAKGNFDFLGIRDSMLIIGRPPMFIWILTGAFKLFGTEMIVLRSLTVLCGIASIVICYSFVRQSLGKTSAFYAALLLAILPEYIYYNRIGFTYDWTSLWMLFSVYALWKYLDRDNQRWLVVTCLAAGVACASDFIGIIDVLVIILVLALYHPKQLWKIFLVAIPILIAVLPIFLTAPSDVWSDLVYTFTIAKGGEGMPGYQLSRALVVYPEMVQRQPLIVLGIFGIFIIPNLRLRGILLLELVGIITLLSFSRTLTAHYLLPVWPLIAIGLGYFLEKTVIFFFNNVKPSLVNLNISQRWKINDTMRSSLGSIIATLLLFVFIFLPISWIITKNIQGLLIEPLHPSTVMLQVGWLEGYVTADDAQSIAREIIKNTKPDDFVISPGVVSWMLPCNASDIRTVFAYEYGGKIPGVRDIRSRFTVNSSLSNAKYAVVDNTWRIWWVDSAPEIATMLDEVESWPLTMSQGSLQLFCNPKYCR